MTKFADRKLVVIGENIHATRLVLRKGKRVVEHDGAEVVLYTTADGAPRHLPIPEEAKKTKDYDEGRVKHVQIAIELAMGEIGSNPAAGLAYLRELVAQLETAGADILDLNVDEVSPMLAKQTATIAWLVGAVQEMTALPLSVDSSSVAVIEAGLTAHDPARVRPMLNSASLERLDALDLAASHNARVVVTAAGAKGMPDGAAARIENASAMVEAARERGFALGDIFIDPLVFPVSVDTEFGHHCLDAIRGLREKFGSEIHITGGISNVSFGIPSRRLLNEMFMVLAVEAGADAGIIDPVVSPLDKLATIDRTAPPYDMAAAVLLGRDEHCKNYIRAWRKGELSAPAA